MTAKMLRIQGIHIVDEPVWEHDVVCGMDVDPRTTHYSHTYNGKLYYFCIESCLKRFIMYPEMYVS